MTAQPHPSQFELELDPEANPEARAARRIAVAHRLVEMGLEVAEAVQRRALAQLAAEAEGQDADDGEAATCEAPRGRRTDPVAAVERIARTVRLSLALAARLDSDEPVRRARARSDEAAERDAEAEARKRAREAREFAELVHAAQREDMVFEVLEATLKAEGLDRDDVHERAVEISERVAESLSEREWEYDYVRRPVGAVIARLCEDFGLEPDWSLWADQAWAIEEAATNAEGSPYAEGGAAWVERAASEPADSPPEEPVSANGSSP
jgi:hypothetical protein